MKFTNQKSLPSFKGYTLDLDHFCLKNYQDEIFIEPRLMRLLGVLHKNANSIVNKQEIMDLVWQNVVVNEESLPRAILDLKRVLNARFSDPPEIETIRKVGYRLVLNQGIKQTGTKNSIPLVGKSVLIIIAIFLFIIMLIRAINY